MNKCPACRSKNIVKIEDAYICKSCDYIGGADELTTLKKMVRKKDKEARKREADAELTRLQQEKTREPYLRFRVFVVEDKNGPEFTRNPNSESRN